jgi:hypothetical protein
MDKLEIKQGSFIQQTQYFIPVEIDLYVVPTRLEIWFFHLSRRTTVIQDLLVRRQFSLVPDNRTNVNVEAWCLKISPNISNTNLSLWFWVGCDFPGVLLGVLDDDLPSCFPGVLWGVCVVLAVGVFGVFPGVLTDLGLRGDKGPPKSTIYIQYHH